MCILASKEVYRPPRAQGQSNFKLHEMEPARYVRPAGALPPGYTGGNIMNLHNHCDNVS